jgi:penicillin-insensitive murein endopeptidase
LVILLSGVALAAAEPAKFLFGAKNQPSEMNSASHGEYAKGCLAGGVELPETGPAWQAMRLSRNRNWGHPGTISFIQRFSSQVQQVGWPGIYVGDISQPRGGPMRSGHRSHQIGLDIDIWLRRPDRLDLSRAAREKISSHRVVAGNRKKVNRYWTDTHHQVLRAAASDAGVARIFVNAAIKQELCLAEPASADREWLRKIRPWWGHDAHFHVRLNCPADSPDCVAQAPIPAGDGCDETLAWWFTDEALNPKPKPGAKPRRALTLADLPRACAAVVTQ